MSTRLAVFMALVSLLVAPATGSAAPMIGSCPIFPADHAWNTRIDTLPVHPMSGAWINSIGPSMALHPDFGTFYLGGPIGIPFIQTTNADPLVPIVFGPDGFPGESDPPFDYRVPLTAPIEGVPPGDGDRHVLAVDVSNCVLYELYRAFPGPVSWTVDAAVRFDLQGYALRPDTWTSADAAGLPIFAGLVRYEEANAGLIEHAIRFTTNRTFGPHLWPARHDADTGGPGDPPMGARFRLKATKDIDTPGYSTRVRAIFQAMKTYGLILADNGSRWYISGEHNPLWGDSELVDAFNDLRGSDFEAVDVSSLIIDPNSGQANQPGPSVFGGGIFVATGRVTSGTGPAQVVTGPGPGRVAEVRVFDADGTQRVNYQVYPSGYLGGIRVAACDFTGDGRAEVVTVAGPGGAPHVRVMQFDANGAFVADLASFFAYELGFVGGLFVACGDIDGDGQPEIVLGVDAGGGPHVRILRYPSLTVLDEFFAYEAGFRGGIRVAVGNVDGSDRASLILGAGPGGGPHVRVLRYQGAPGSWQELVSVMVYELGFRQGIFVAAGDLAGDGRAEVVTSADAGGGPHVRVLGYDPGVPGGLAAVSEFMAYDTGFRGGVRVAVGDVLTGAPAEIVTGAGAGGGPHVSVRTPDGTPSGPGFLAY